MTKKKFAVIFDCDGTLADSLNLGMGSYNYAIEKVGGEFRRPEEIKQYFGSSADKILFQLLGDKEQANQAFEYYFEHEALQVSRILLHEGIAALLKQLKSLNVGMGIVTGRHERDLHLILNHHGIHHYFEAIVCDNHVERSKPSPDGILLAASQLGLAPERVYYIGDSVMDILAANSAGAKGIAALWDQLVKIEAMEKANPVSLANSPQEVMEYILREEAESVIASA